MKIIIILLTFITSIIYSQNAKTYSGKYSSDDGNYFNDYGTVIYTYNEDVNSERIKEGKFIFKGNELSVNGQYKNGIRTGLWKIKYTNKHSFFRPYIIVLSAQYIDGKLNGKCSYAKTLNSSKLVLEKSEAIFKDNLLVGLYTFDKYYDNHGANKRILIKYFQDTQGQLNGEYKTEFYHSGFGDLGQIEDVITFKDGLMTYRLLREITNGKVYLKFEDGNYTKGKVEDYDVFGSNWDARIALNFWINTIDNPLYSFKEGINKDGFITFAERVKLKTE